MAPRESTAIAALDAVFVLADQAQKPLLNRPFVLRIPGDGEANMRGLRGKAAEDDAWGTEITNARGDKGDSLAGFDKREDTGPGGGGVDDVRREAGR